MPTNPAVITRYKHMRLPLKNKCFSSISACEHKQSANVSSEWPQSADSHSENESTHHLGITTYIRLKFPCLIGFRYNVCDLIILIASLYERAWLQGYIDIRARSVWAWRIGLGSGRFCKLHFECSSYTLGTHSRDREYVRGRGGRGGYISLFAGMFPFAPSTIMLIIYDARAASANKTDRRMLVNFSLER